MLVPKFLALKGPRGTYSQVWMSRADQSFMRTKPKMESEAEDIGMREPRALPLHIKQPNSSSISRRLQCVKVGCFSGEEGSRRICPHGRMIGVDEMTTEDERP